jgi:hypothetical protein
MHGHSTSMVAASPHGGPRYIFRGVHAPGGYGAIPVFAAQMAA